MALRVDEQEEKRGISIRKGDGGTEPGQLNSLQIPPSVPASLDFRFKVKKKIQISSSSLGNIFPK